MFLKRQKRHAKINLGGGNFQKEGWCNLDISTNYDISKRLLRDFANDSADIIFSSHFIEHIHPEKVRLLLKNVYRVLGKGGVVRISAPDCDTLTEKVLQGKEAFMAFIDTFYDCNAMGADWLHWYLYLCGNPEKFGEPNAHPPTRHCWMMNANTIIYFLICVGFEPAKIYKSAFGQSKVPEFRELIFDNRKEISFFVEAIK